VVDPDSTRTKEHSVEPTLPQPRPTADVPVLVQRTARLLEAHVPLTLLLDLAAEEGPHSEERYRDEQADLSWLQAV
jgi:hypothetical protein